MANAQVASALGLNGTPLNPAQPKPVLSPIQVQQPQAQSIPQATPQSAPQANGLDPKIVTLAQSIRQVESNGNFQAKGASGEYGAYQFMPDTWATDSKTYLGQSIPIEQATPEQQNEVAYKSLADQMAAHPDWNVGNFASWWNSGDPQAYLNDHKGVNAEGVSYDTPAYAQKVAEAYQQFKGSQPAQNAPTAQANPSVGGFLGNALSSAGNFAGNLLNAVAHPIQTGQNLLETGAGALQELGGQSNDNTVKFDQLKDYFIQKYGGVSNIEHTLYTDPVSVLADLSTVFGGAGAIAGGIGKVGEIAGLADAADTVGTVASGLNRAADLTNPLTPVISGAGTLLNKTGDLAADTTGELTNLKGSTVKSAFNGELDAETVANTSRQSISKEIGEALNEKIDELSDTGKGYEPIKQAGEIPEGYENIKNVPPENSIPVASNFLEEELRNTAKLKVEDGSIKPTTTSRIGKTEIPKLQGILDTFKPSFQRGYLTNEEFLNLRSQLAKAAYNDSGIKNSDVAEVAEDMRNNLNKNYRGAVPGLEELDNQYSAQISELKTLRKGFIDKSGELLPSAINKVGRALNKGNDDTLARLEKISPGITHKLEVLKAVEDIEKETSGTTNNLLRTGGVFGAFATGRLDLIALSIASTIIDKPGIAVPLIRALGSNKELAGAVIQKLSRYLTLSSTANKAVNTPPENQVQPATDQSPAGTPPQTITENPSSVSSDLTQLASNKNFDLAAARKAGYSDADILAFLQTQK